MLNNDLTQWKPLKYHPVQSAGWLSKARYRLSPAGRRSGKTEIFGKRSLVLKAFAGEADWRGFVGAPTREQVKRIYWSDLKRMIPKNLMLKKPEESRLIISLVHGPEIHLLGLDKPERIEGTPWNHGILDEYGNMKERVWPEHVRPSLADRKGTCDFIGVPEGRNHYYDLWKKCLADDTGVWAGFHWKSADILSEEEITQAKIDLDELVYRQEFEGSFVEFAGRCYYNFKEKKNVAKIRYLYDDEKPLILCFDFNVAPGTASIIQEIDLNPDDTTVFNLDRETFTGVLGEVYIPRDSNTVKVCNKIVEEWGKHKGLVHIYGDSTGGAKGSAKVKGSDWDLVEEILKPVFRSNYRMDVPLSNPRERIRINAMNSRILNSLGSTNFIVDGKHAPYTVKDFEGVRILKGSAGEIDKKIDPKLTHLSDGIGYYVSKRFPVKKYVKSKPQNWK